MLSEPQLSLELAKLSHDLNTPLGVISATAEIAKKMLNDNPITEETSKIFEEHMDAILYNIRRMSAIIDNLKSLDDMYDDVEITESINIKDYFSMFCKSLKSYEIKFSFKITCEINTTNDNFSIRPNTLHRALLNLVNNSIKYNSKNKKKIKIIVTDDSQNTYIKVIDNGDGISNSNLSRVTEIFYRENQDDKKGMGLGLPIVKRCIGKMSGSLKIESEKNKSTTVTIVIPNNPSYVFRDMSIDLTPSKTLVNTIFNNLSD